MTSLLASAKSIALELSTLRAKHISRQSSGVGGSHQTVIQWQCRPLVNWQANTLERVITKISQDVIEKIRADWVFMEMDWASAEW